MPTSQKKTGGRSPVKLKAKKKKRKKKKIKKRRATATGANIEAVLSGRSSALREKEEPIIYSPDDRAELTMKKKVSREKPKMVRDTSMAIGNKVLLQKTGLNGDAGSGEKPREPAKGQRKLIMKRAKTVTLSKSMVNLDATGKGDVFKNSEDEDGDGSDENPTFGSSKKITRVRKKRVFYLCLVLLYKSFGKNFSIDKWKKHPDTGAWSKITVEVEYMEWSMWILSSNSRLRI
jgi:hypothetical protein